MRKCSPTVYRSLLLACCLMLAGCGSGDQAADMFAEANDSNIKRVSSLYAVFQGKNNYKGPKDLAELKSFVKEQNVDHLKRIGVDPDKLDELFVGRDGEPFNIRWELVVRPRSAPIPIVFEQTGIDGKYQVAFSGYGFEEVDKAKYDQLWAGELDNGEAPTRGDAQANE